MRKEYVKISKYLSFILRHHPEKAGIALDAEGYTNLNILLRILNDRYENLNLGEITEDTLKDIIKESDKLRFEINNDRIRAFYGHSIDIKIEMQEAKELPEKLYHGTTFKAWMLIKEQGLQSKGRQYVHLSEDIRTAKLVGKRRTIDPIILEIDAGTAQKEMKFFKSGDMYLTKYIPPKFISRMENKSHYSQ